ncbi:unnamed protein product [Pleuronectes platessa]|uniref:Uncharacterized protein n=1 Tax=Pleuronectes platessa TaxID=8262 RepID=A0A9N7YAQ9_PLEPL|nr:unnamed protein product [Pleuronectes platessa]
MQLDFAVHAALDGKMDEQFQPKRRPGSVRLKSPSRFLEEETYSLLLSHRNTPFWRMHPIGTNGYDTGRVSDSGSSASAGRSPGTVVVLEQDVKVAPAPVAWGWWLGRCSTAGPAAPQADKGQAKRLAPPRAVGRGEADDGGSADRDGKKV